VGKDRDDGTLSLHVAKDSRPRAAPGDACLILLYPPGPDLGSRTMLAGDEYIVGRVAEADIVVDRESVSRRHARIAQIEDDRWVVEDLGSTNGTFVNDQRITRQPLTDGDQVRIGNVIYKFLSGSHVEAAYHEEIYRMTILDGLTEVHNRRYFLEFLERELARALRHDQPLTLVMFDIDRFKQINDSRGHLAGDAVLKQLAAVLRPRMRREDLLARYGGEEFGAILTVTERAGGLLFAEDLRRRVEQHTFEVDGETVPVTISLGVTTAHREPQITPQELIRRADEKLYEAKRDGRNRVAG
jgi:diguanylate cyclase (GGDEF)-like protein